MIRTRHCLLASMAAFVTLAVAAQAVAQTYTTPAASTQLGYNGNKYLNPIQLNGYNNNTGATIDIGNSVLITTTTTFAYVPAGNSPNQIGVTGTVEGSQYAGGNAASASNSYAAFRDAWADGYDVNTSNSNILPWASPNGIVSSWVANSSYNIGIGWINNNDQGYTNFNNVALSTYDAAGNGTNLSIVAPAYIGDAFLQGLPTTDTLNLIGKELALGANAGHPGHGTNFISSQPQGQATWEDGDFFDQGFVTADDLNATGKAVALANLGQLPNLGYNPNSNSPVVAAAAVSAVPEPGTIGLLLAFALSVFVVRARCVMGR